jgi:hypothetical protein
MKHFFVAIFLITALNLFAQDVNPTQKGNLMLGGGGSIGYGSDLGETSSGNFSFSLSPSVGFFLSDGFALGVAPLVSLNTSFSDNSYNSVSVGTGLFLVKYFGIGIFVRGTVGYDLNHYYSSSLYYTSNSIHSIYIIPEVGYAFFLGPNVALELSLKDVFDIRINDSSTTFSSRTKVSAGFQIFL